MTGTAGTRGPIPKRHAERAGHRATADRPDVVRKDSGTAVPPPDPSWLPEAADWYASLATSGQSRYYEPSDWQYARVVATMLSSLLSSDRPSAELFKAVASAMADLGTTEGARRRMRIEVDRPAPAPEVDAAKVAVMARYREMK